MPNQDYITVTAQKTVLPYDRVLLKTFYGVVHSTIIVHDDVGDPRSITTFDSMDPTLTAIDKRAGGKMVQPADIARIRPVSGHGNSYNHCAACRRGCRLCEAFLLTLQKMSNIGWSVFFGGGGLRRTAHFRRAGVI